MICVEKISIIRTCTLRKECCNLRSLYVKNVRNLKLQEECLSLTFKRNIAITFVPDKNNVFK